MFAFGSLPKLGGSSADYRSTELMDTQTMKWTTKQEYPYEEKIFAARSLFYSDQFIIFGGELGYSTVSRIAAYNPQTDNWSTLGFLKTKRTYTSVIQMEDEFLIIGGLEMDESESNSRRSERCRFDGAELVCHFQSPLMPAGGKYKY